MVGEAMRRALNELAEADPDWLKTIALPEWYSRYCLLYTSDAADERSSVDLGGRRIIKKKNTKVEMSEARIYNT